MISAKSKLGILLLSFILMLCPVCLVAAEGKGNAMIEIFPLTPQESPATFQISVKTGGPANIYQPYIFLVMTHSSWDGLTSNVIVDWTGGQLTITKGEFTGENVNEKKVPDDTHVPDKLRYTVESLKDHLGTSETVHWVFMPFLSGSLTKTPTTFTVTFSSANPKMLVYSLGKETDDNDEDFAFRVTPTDVGFVVPEPATIVAVATSLIALIGYTTLKNKNLL